MAQALAALSPHKATPPGLATNSLWKVTADIVAPTLCQWTRQWTHIPALWKNAWLALIPKIPRPISPKNLRPIGLTESSGRAYASLLQAQLRPIAAAFLQNGAQFAYLPGRNAAQAIHRVAGHCQFVQQQCSYATPTVVDRHAQQPKRNPHFAGVQLSLDLSSAFDLLDWRLLDKALQSAHTPLELKLPGSVLKRGCDRGANLHPCCGRWPLSRYIGNYWMRMILYSLRRGCNAAPPHMRMIYICVRLCGRCRI